MMRHSVTDCDLKFIEMRYYEYRDIEKIADQSCREMPRSVSRVSHTRNKRMLDFLKKKK